MTTPRLILFPSVADAIPPDLHQWRASLLDAGLTGAPLSSSGDECFRTGKRFLDFVSFLGCSPTLNLDGSESDKDSPNTYSIEVPVPVAEVQFLGDPAGAPRCPGCGAGFADWRDHMPDKVQDELPCPHCGKGFAAMAWNWRRQAGFGRYWINVRGVHEGEAVPTDSLLAALKRLSGVVWDYAYSRT
ncbi:MAG: hypothetical protein P8X48_02560 [Acidiferrobacteraceae bacterium]